MNKCSDCQSNLEKGVLLDSTYGANLIQRFAKSDNIPTDTKTYMIRINETEFNDVRRVIAYRCTKCNRIFQYAQDVILTQSLNKRLKRYFIIMFIAMLAMSILLLFMLFVGFSFLNSRQP